MSVRRFNVWLDSGANVHSCRRAKVSLDDLGFTSDEWDAMTDDEKEGLMRDVAFECSDWGFEEIEAKE